jgi:hypothetical protein
LINPYNNVYEWLVEEELDVEALMDALNTFNGLYEKKEKILGNISEIEKELSNLRSGRKSLKSLISFNLTKDQQISKYDFQKNQNERNLIYIEEIIKIVSVSLEKFIEGFKAVKLNSYYLNLKFLSEFQRVNADNIGELWNAVSNDKNIKNI